MVSLRIVGRRGDDIVPVTAMRALSNNNAGFRTIGSQNVVPIAGERFDVPDDRRHIELLGRLVRVRSNPDMRDAVIPVLMRGMLRDTDDPPIRHCSSYFRRRKYSLSDDASACSRSVSSLMSLRIHCSKVRPVLLPQGAR